MSTAGRSHLQSWLQELRAEGGALPPDCPSWQEGCIEQAIKAAGSSALGGGWHPLRGLQKDQLRWASSKLRRKL
eukprot:11594660-Alexandrium_andersonii.AAC.1